MLHALLHRPAPLVLQEARREWQRLAPAACSAGLQMRLHHLSEGWDPDVRAWLAVGGDAARDLALLEPLVVLFVQTAVDACASMELAVDGGGVVVPHHAHAQRYPRPARRTCQLQALPCCGHALGPRLPPQARPTHHDCGADVGHALAPAVGWLRTRGDSLAAAVRT